MADDVRTPWLSDLVCAVSAPTQVWCGPDGEVDGARGIEGFWHGDVRVVRSAVLTVDGDRVTPVLVAPDGASGIVTVGVARHLGEAADPVVRVERRRTVAPGVGREDLLVTATVPTSCTLRLEITSDLAPVDVVRGGRAAHPLAPAGDGSWGADGVRAAVVADDATVTGGAVVLTRHVEVSPGHPWRGCWQVRAEDAHAVVAAPPSRADWASRVRVETADVRVTRWVARALADLDGLRMTHPARPDDVFVAAGAPWYLTLFGRDALWTARMLLPLGWELAASTLRVLAAFQGVRHDPATAEEPGKVLHEVRRGAAQHGGSMALPPVYFGTVDATPLWVCLLHEAWRAGMPDEQVEELLPNLEAALAWQESFGDEFLHYVDASGTGLANQGWKDSHDSVRWNDGGFAQPPIALCEVQGYAHQAAVGGAEVLEHFGRPGARHREWARRLRARFRAEFWVTRADGSRFPAIALDGAGRAVDSLSSNVGHLLGTGLLDAQESALVAAHLASPVLAEGFGLRTLASDAASFSPLSYHNGSVWAHDTAIAITGLVREGFVAQARPLVDGLLAAAEAFGYRVPELHGGDARADVPVPVPYPASCRPQAWSAAAAVAVLDALTRSGEAAYTA